MLGMSWASGYLWRGERYLSPVVIFDYLHGNMKATFLFFGVQCHRIGVIEPEEQLSICCVQIAFYLLHQAARDRRLATTVLASVEKESEKEAGPTLATKTPRLMDEVQEEYRATTSSRQGAGHPGTHPRSPS